MLLYILSHFLIIEASNFQIFIKKWTVVDDFCIFFSMTASYDVKW
jgi:hypothetical protein